LREYKIDSVVADEQPFSIFGAERQGIPMKADVRETGEVLRFACAHARATGKWRSGGRPAKAGSG
jgi:hypothetical protein